MKVAVDWSLNKMLNPWYEEPFLVDYNPKLKQFEMESFTNRKFSGFFKLQRN